MDISAREIIIVLLVFVFVGAAEVKRRFYPTHPEPDDEPYDDG